MFKVQHLTEKGLILDVYKIRENIELTMDGNYARSVQVIEFLVYNEGRWQYVRADEYKPYQPSYKFDLPSLSGWGGNNHEGD